MSWKRLEYVIAKVAGDDRQSIAEGLSRADRRKFGIRPKELVYSVVACVGGRAVAEYRQFARWQFVNGGIDLSYRNLLQPAVEPLDGLGAQEVGIFVATLDDGIANFCGSP